MKILLLTHLFNSLAQRLFVELRAAGHEVTVEFDIADAVTEEAVALAQPDLVLAPFMKRRIPESVWRRHLCLVVHPGPPGDGGPSALDHAVLDGERRWGVTVLQATGEFDAGPVWAWAPLALREASKGELYRREVVDAAVHAVRDALARWRPGGAGPTPPPVLPAQRGRWQPLVTAAERAVDWARDDTETVLRKVRSADGAPGAQALLGGRACRLFDAHRVSAATLARALAGAPQAAPGESVARRGPALLVRTRDGGVWIGHLRGAPAAAERPALKLAATRVFAAEAASLPELAVPLERAPQGDGAEWDELRYDESGPEGARVGWLEFEFHHGAMSTRQCERLLAALAALRARPTQVLVLAGGAGFFSNGIHLHDIEAAADMPGDSAADASWRNINAIDDVALALIGLTDRLVVATLRGNAGAGGCFLALAADEVWAHGGVVLNPHYKNMGNLYGSEYWTYLLPQRVGGRPDEGACRRIMQGRLPIGVREALALGLIDRCLADDAVAFEAAAREAALALAASPDRAARVAAKASRRAADEAAKPLAQYRAEELGRMQRNFYGFDPSYHVARHHFVARKPQAWTPRHLAAHRTIAATDENKNGGSR